MPGIAVVPGNRTEGTTMRTFEHKSYKTCKTCYLSVALFAAVFALFVLYAPYVHAQGRIIVHQPEEKQKEPETGIVTLEGKFTLYGTFIFRGNTITYKHGTRDKRQGPTQMMVNGKLWSNSAPFELGFMPDFSHAEIMEQECGGKVELKLRGDELQLKLDQRKAGEDFRIVLQLFDPEQGVKPVDKSMAGNKRTIPSKMDLVRIEKPDDPAQHAASGEQTLVTDETTGIKKLPSKMDLVRIEKEKLPDSIWLFRSIVPRRSSYPTKSLIRRMLMVPQRMWRIEDEEYGKDWFNQDSPWVRQPPHILRKEAEEKDERAKQELEKLLFKD